MRGSSAGGRQGLAHRFPHRLGGRRNDGEAVFGAAPFQPPQAPPRVLDAPGAPAPRGRALPADAGVQAEQLAFARRAFETSSIDLVS